MSIVIIGSGAGGVTLAEELRKLLPEQPIRLITQETHGVYARPMLSHGFTREDIETKIILKSFAALEADGIQIDAGCTVTAIHPDQHEICLMRQEHEESVSYQSLILAPGSEAFVPASFKASLTALRVINSLDDLIHLRRLRESIHLQGQTPHWALIGGGLIGCEVASDMARAGDTVTLIHPLEKLMERQLMDADAESLKGVLEEQGVKVLLNTAVTSVSPQGAQGYLAETAGGPLGPFSGVLLCTGFKPRTELAAQAGLETGRGIRVDDWMKTSAPDIFAIGDAVECANGRIYAYILPVKQQAQWLAQYLAGRTTDPWTPPSFKPRAKVHGFVATHPYHD